MGENYILPFLWMRGEKEEVIREELSKICECGIRAVCVEARPHDDFCGPGWWHDMDIVLDEAKKKGMKVWILDDRHFPTGYANGLIETKYPQRRKLYLACTTADVFGAQRPLTLEISRMLKPSAGYWDLGKPVNSEERKNNRLYAAVAVKFAQHNLFWEDAVDLTDCCNGDFVSFKLPKGQWRIFVLYLTRTDGGDESYINMIDKESAYTQIEGVYEAHFAKYGHEFGKTIAGFFSDEPQFGNVTAYNSFDTQTGRFPMQLPWSLELQGILEALYGDRLRTALPFLFAQSVQKELQTQIRFDYMDQVSRLYQKNFSDTVGAWCESHGVLYIGHVVEDNGLHSRLGMGAAHYFRAVSGQHMAGIDCIGGQVIYGAAGLHRKGMVDGDGEFYHYVLGKLGASAGHLDPKKKGRTMCELFGAYGWGFGVRDMKYVLDHMLVKGINYLVPHAFSMAGYPDADCPPHFYARGNHPQFLYFARLMKYANRMCGLLNGGRHAASVAVLYDGEADWAGGNMPLQKVCRVLLENQIDFDIVSLDMLSDLSKYNGKTEGGKLYINDVKFEALLIPYMPRIPGALSRFISRYPDIYVIFADKKPEGVIGEYCVNCSAGAAGENSINGIAGAAQKHRIKNLAEAGRKNATNGIALERCAQIPLENLARTLWEKGIYDIRIRPGFSELSFYHYISDRHLFVFQNESASERFHGEVQLPVTGSLAYYDAMEDVYESLPDDPVCGNRKNENTGNILHLELEPGECVTILERGESVCIREHRSFCAQIKDADSIDISKGWTVSMAGAKEYPHFSNEILLENLEPVSDRYPEFSGIIRYEKKITLDRIPKECIFYAQQVYEAMRVFINGKEAGFRLFPPYQTAVGDYLREGENTIVIETATTPAREQLKYPRPPFDFSHTPLEPSGMSGEVKLFVRNG